MGEYSRSLPRRIRGKTLGGEKHFMAAAKQYTIGRGWEKPEPRPMTGFWNTLTPEQQALVLSGTLDEDPRPDPVLVVPPHPSKCPKHEGAKGSVWDGICNITRCNNRNAEHFNIATRGYYCPTCAAGINYHPAQPRLCVPVDHDLTHAEMEQLYDGQYRR